MFEQRLGIARHVHALLCEEQVDRPEVNLTDFGVGEVGTITLPRPQSLPTMTLRETLSTRTSRYVFSDQASTPLQLASLLRWAMGRQREVHLPAGESRRMKMAASGGGLPSVQAFLVVPPGGEIPPGVYTACPDTLVLTTVRHGDPTTAMRSVLTQHEFVSPGVTFVVLVADLEISLRKYTARHYRTLHIDTGIIIENLYLVAAALGMRGCAITGFHDHALDTLALLQPTQFTTAVFAVGTVPSAPSTSALSRDDLPEHFNGKEARPVDES